MKTKLSLLVALLICFPMWNIQAKELTVDVVNTTSSGSVLARAQQVTFVFSATFTGTINTVSMDWAAGGTLTVKADQAGDTLGAITYTVTAGTLHIIRVQ